MTNKSALLAFPASLGVPHQNTEIEPRDMDQVTLVNVLASTQPRPAHAAAIEDMGKAAFDHFPAPAHGLAPELGFQPVSVGIDGLPGRLIPMPPQIAVGGLRLSDACLPNTAVEAFQTLAGMVAFVGHKFTGLQSGIERRRVPFVGRMDR